MNTPTIEMPREAAAEQLAEISDAPPRADQREFETINRKLLEELAAGHTLIDVDQAIRTAPVDEQFRPMLAIARSDRQEVRFTWTSHWHGNVYTRDIATFDARRDRTKNADGTMVVDVNMAREKENSRAITGFATVPRVPPRIRPSVGQLKQFFTLFEVEEWQDKSRFAVNPDPYLLTHVWGPIYRKVDEWDLSPIEIKAMELAQVG